MAVEQYVPGDSKVNFVVHDLLPIAERSPRRPSIRPNPAIIERHLLIVFDEIPIQLNNVGVLYEVH